LETESSGELRPVTLTRAAGLERLRQVVEPEIAAASAGAADRDHSVGRLDQAGVRDALDANIPGAVQDRPAQRDSPRHSGWDGRLGVFR